MTHIDDGLSRNRSIATTLIGLAGIVVILLLGTLALLPALSQPGDISLGVLVVVGILLAGLSIYFGGAGVAYGPGTPGPWNRFDAQAKLGIASLGTLIFIVAVAITFQNPEKDSILQRQIGDLQLKLESEVWKLQGALNDQDRRISDHEVQLKNDSASFESIEITLAELNNNLSELDRIVRGLQRSIGEPESENID